MYSPGLMINGFETGGDLRLKVSLWHAPDGFEESVALLEEVYTIPVPGSDLTPAQQLRDILVSIAEHL